MNFVSFAFLGLLAIVVAARLTVGRRKVEPVYGLVLLVASLVFYVWHIPIYLWVLVVSTVIDYVAARAIAHPGRSPGVRKQLLALSLVTNLGLLAVFKYFGFFLENLQSFAGAAGLDWQAPSWRLLLPIGISFYTFQSMSYTIDVYRGRFAPVDSFWRFLLFISFFPQLVAGPIVRASEFLPQMPRVRRVRWASVSMGVALMVEGYFLKMVCADNIGPLVDKYWDAAYEPGANSVVLVWLALMFSGQIFCDFAGYSQIARGIAYVLGYQLPVNFNQPYIAGSFKNFWERWHMTLSRWLRDYLYIPLGGNRVSPLRTYANLMAVMLLGGLWHGAAWTFVAWGALHGGALAVERALGLHVGLEQRPFFVRWAWAVVVQVTVLVTWVFFRSSSFAGATQFLANVVAFEWARPTPEMWMGSMFLLPVAIGHLWALAVARGIVGPLAPMGRAVLTGVLVYGILASYGNSNAFIYFQF